jgi:hypothetical protein
MERLSSDLILISAVDLLGFAACATTLLTFAQSRMWPMRILAITANICFLGYGFMGLLYPVLLLHLMLLPLNVARLIQLVGRDQEPRAGGLKQSGLHPIPDEPQKSTSLPPLRGGQWEDSVGRLSNRSLIWGHLGSAPP